MLRHILMKPNALQDDATVKQKLAGIRERILKGEDFAAFAVEHVRGSGTVGRRRRHGLDQPGHLRAGVRQQRSPA